MSGISTLSGSFSTDTSVNSPIWIAADSGQKRTCTFASGAPHALQGVHREGNARVRAFLTAPGGRRQVIESPGKSQHRPVPR
jgi:hypothetical protein